MVFDIQPIVQNDYPPCLNNFLNYLETIKGKSQNTLNGYKIDLVIFLRYMVIYKGRVSNKTDFSEVKISDIDGDFMNSITLQDMYSYMTFLEKCRNNGPYTRARKVAALKSFFKYLHAKEKLIKENPTLELESPKIDKRHPVYLSLDQSIALLHSLDKSDINYYRDYCILTLFLNCGMRLSELCNIRISKIKGDTLTIIGKGNKERTVYLNAACLTAIKEYMNVRDDSKASDDQKDFLFLSNRNKKICGRTVEIMVKKHITEAGITGGKYTPHKLRHSAATIMYKHGHVDLRKLQYILGHESISTTELYTHIDRDDLRDAINSNPLANITL